MALKTPAQRRHFRRHLPLILAAQREVRRMDARCVPTPDGYGIGGQTYPWGWEPAPPETQDAVTAAAAGVWLSRRYAASEVACLRGWNDDADGVRGGA